MFSQICLKSQKKLVLTGLLSLMLFAVPGYGFAQSWADSMFEIKSHNFGSVPLKSDTQHEFVFTNKLKQDIQIRSVDSSCMCTDVSYSKKVIKSGEQGSIIAKANTSGQIKGKRGATITVTFDKPTLAVVQLEVSVYIRPDVVLDPGSIDFGIVGEGRHLSKTVTLQYAGNPNWTLVPPIVRANNNQYITAKASRVDSPGKNGLVTYKIVVSLNEKDKAPPGDVREILRFKTSEGIDAQGREKTSIIELPVTAFVMDTLVAKPSPFQFGLIRPGETLTKYVVLQAAHPFRVTDARSSDDRFMLFKSDQESRVHIVAVTLTSKQTNDEKVSSTLRIRTDLKDQKDLPIVVRAHFVSAEESNMQECYAPQWKEQIVSNLEYYNNSRSAMNKTQERLDFDDPSKTIFDDLPLDEQTVEKVAKPGMAEDDEESTKPEDDGMQKSQGNDDTEDFEITVISKPNPPVMKSFALPKESGSREVAFSDNTETSVAMKTGKVRFGTPKNIVPQSESVVESQINEIKPVQAESQPELLKLELPDESEVGKTDVKLSAIFADSAFPELSIEPESSQEIKPKSLKPTSASIKGKPLPIVRPIK